MNERRFPVLALAVCACVGLAGCSGDPSPVTADEDWEIDFGRSSSFAGGDLSVFLVLEDVQFRSIHPLIDVSAGGSFDLADVIAERPFETPLPGHEGKALTFLKIHESGTSVAHGALSWDPEHPEDYLMAGWWAQFPGQHLPELSFRDSVQYAIVDGPEMDPSSPPDLPLDGQATYTGQAGGLYAYVAGSDWGEDEGAYVIDEYEGVITILADFADATMSACIGCSGDLVTRRAHFGIFLGDELRDTQSIGAGYELHFGETAFNPDGTFVYDDVTVRHSERTVTQSEGYWGGTFSNIPDASGHPRLVAGFSGADFEESDGSIGKISGTFLALSETVRASEP